MAGLVHHGPHPQPWNWDTNPVPIIGAGTSWEFTPEQSWTYMHPAVPHGYEDWTAYVKDVIHAVNRGEEGPRPRTASGEDMTGGGDVPPSPRTWLQSTIGYGRLAPLLDTSDPEIDEFLNGLYTQSTGKDSFSFFGDEFFPVLAGLEAAVGGAAAYGAFAPATEAATGAAAGTGAGAGTSAALPAVAVNPTMYSAAIGPTLPTFAGGLGAGAGATTRGGLLGTLGSALGLGSGPSSW